MTLDITKGQIGEEDINRYSGPGGTSFTRKSGTGGTATLTKVGYKLDALMVSGGGVNFTRATLVAAATAVGTSVVTILVRPGIWAIGANMDLTALAPNAVFDFTPGAVLAHTTYTLNIPAIEAGRYQIFNGTGAVTLGAGVDEVYPEWFGGKADNSTANVAAINEAIVPGKNISLGDGTYLTTGNHSMASQAGAMIKGLGEKKTVLKKSSTTNPLWTITGMMYQKIKSMTMDGNQLDGATLVLASAYISVEEINFLNQGAGNYALHVAGSAVTRVSNCTVLQSYGGGIYVYGASDPANSGIDLRFENMIMSGDYMTAWMVSLYGVTHATFEHVAFDGIPAAYGFLLFNNYNYSVHFNNCYVEVGANGASGVSVIKIAAAGNNNISFEHNLWTNVSNLGGAWFLQNDYGENILLNDIWFRNTLPGAMDAIIKLGTNSKFFKVSKFYIIDDRTTDYVFIRDVAGSDNTISEDCYRSSDAGAGLASNEWAGVNINVKNTNINQNVAATADYLVFENVTGNINLTNAAVTAHITLINCTGTITDPNNVAVYSDKVFQPTPTAKTTAVTLTVAELRTKIITGTHTAGATVAYTLPIGTDTQAGGPWVTNDAFDWMLINLSAAALDTITLTASSGHTIVGNPIVQSAHSTTGGIYGNSAIWRTRKTAANTFVTYRIS